jgi:hypothetical protein
VSSDIEITGGSDPLVTAAILAAVARLEEERAIVAASPLRPPLQSLWVRSGRPREPVVPVTRQIPAGEGWSVTSDDAEAPNT